ncbi:MAG: dihydrofolate reductase family protein [Anaerolineae bacterium]|jgi:dihydrofolate reductase|nr:dihydrofolate reductase family protein [Anaerolineae bacterium]
MRKLIVLEHISLDGVIQGPGGPDEDTSNGFTFGGWIANYSDPILGTKLRKMMNSSFDLLLGRKTYEIWAPYWPYHADIWPNADKATKYVVSNNLTSADWKPSVILKGNIVEKITRIKQEEGPDLHCWGSSNLLQTLLRHDLVDMLWLMVYPITLGSGKRLFADGTIPAAFKVTTGEVTPCGAIVVRYERSGAITTGKL